MSQLPSQPGKRILSPAEAQHWTEGYAFLEQARQQAESLLEGTAQTVEQARAEGFAQGREEGAAAAAALLLATHGQVDRYLSGLEGQLAALALDAVRQLLEDQDHEVLLAGLVRKALPAFRDEHRLTLRVAPEHHRAVGELLGDDPRIEVLKDAALGPRQALLSSPAAVIDLSLDAQLQGLRNALGLAR